MDDLAPPSEIRPQARTPPTRESARKARSLRRTEIVCGASAFIPSAGARRFLVVADEPNHDVRCCFVLRFGQSVRQSDDAVCLQRADGAALVRARGGGRVAGARSSCVKGANIGVTSSSGEGWEDPGNTWKPVTITAGPFTLPR